MNSFLDTNTTESKCVCSDLLNTILKSKLREIVDDLPPYDNSKKCEEDESKERYVSYKFDKYLSKLPVNWVAQVVQMFVDTAQENKLGCGIFGSTVHKAFNDIDIDPQTDVDMVVEGVSKNGNWDGTKFKPEFEKSFNEKLQKFTHNDEMEYELKIVYNSYMVDFESTHIELIFTKDGNYIYKFDIICVNHMNTFIHGLHGFDHLHVWYDPISEQLKADECILSIYDLKTTKYSTKVTYMDVTDIMKDYKNKILGCRYYRGCLIYNFFLFFICFTILILYMHFYFINTICR
jgi:hypothetical protein